MDALHTWSSGDKLVPLRLEGEFFSCIRNSVRALYEQQIPSSLLAASVRRPVLSDTDEFDEKQKHRDPLEVRASAEQGRWMCAEEALFNARSNACCSGKLTGWGKGEWCLYPQAVIKIHFSVVPYQSKFSFQTSKWQVSLGCALETRHFLKWTLPLGKYTGKKLTKIFVVHDKKYLEHLELATIWQVRSDKESQPNA